MSYEYRSTDGYRRYIVSVSKCVVCMVCMCMCGENYNK